MGAINRPYVVTWPMLLLASLIPGYLVVAAYAHEQIPSRPDLALDHWLPVAPQWVLIYGAMYLFLILLPVLVVQDRDLIDRTVRAYLLVWLASFVCFAAYPTVAHRPEEVVGQGFAAWGLRALYQSDPPYNCFPSLHVAHSFVSAWASYQVHRGLGYVALVCASLVAISTLFTKQHYVADVVLGVLLAWLAYRLFIRRHQPNGSMESHKLVAPWLALIVAGVALSGVLVSWLVYWVNS